MLVKLHRSYETAEHRDCFSCPQVLFKYKTTCMKADRLRWLTTIGPPIADMQTGKQLS